MGLLAYAAVKVVAPVFYALKRPRVPVIASMLAVAANVLLSVLLHPRYGYRVLALGTSVAAICNLAVLLGSFQRIYGGVLRGEMMLALLRISVAAGVMGVALFGLDRAAAAVAAPALGAGSASSALVQLLIAGPAGLAIYGGLCWLMGLEEMRALGERLKRRRR